MQAGFVSAARDGQLDAVREAIAAGIAVDRKDSTGYAALFWAVAKGHDAIVSELLRAGASVHTSCHGMPVTWRAATDSTVVILKMLLAAGGSVNGARKDGMTPLISLARSANGAKRRGCPCHRMPSPPCRFVLGILHFCICVAVERRELTSLGNAWALQPGCRRVNLLALLAVVDSVSSVCVWNGLTVVSPLPVARPMRVRCMVQELQRGLHGSCGSAAVEQWRRD